MHAKTQLFDVELKSFVLIADVQTDHLDTLIHGNSISSDPLTLPLPSCRRFSETAIMRSGRWAALRKQAGTHSG